MSGYYIYQGGGSNFGFGEWTFADIWGGIKDAFGLLEGDAAAIKRVEAATASIPPTATKDEAVAAAATAYKAQVAAEAAAASAQQASTTSMLVLLAAAAGIGYLMFAKPKRRRARRNAGRIQFRVRQPGGRRRRRGRVRGYPTILRSRRPLPRRATSWWKKYGA